ncbi:MAG: hypothetical protein PWP08_100 [Methanofollis sp.]|nr:hypothetical protein [Methanofollis sp.]
MKTIKEIGRKVDDGTAVVLTAAELKTRIRDGERPTPADVDVVTCGTFGVMSGTAAVLSLPVAGPGSFARAESVTLNGVPAFPGPCPNERLGIVDLIVYGTAHAGPRYGGGHLFADLAAGREIAVAVVADGKEFSRTVTIADCNAARLFTTRSAFKNYTAYVNRECSVVRTIFSATGLSGPCAEVSVSGCGEINPIENDPSLRFIRPGSRVLVNGAPGFVMGEGTRSSKERPNIMAFAGIREMNPRYCGGFVTSAGPECLTSVAAAIPVLDDAGLRALSVLDENITLPVADVNDRRPFARADYGAVWQGTNRHVTYDPAACAFCEQCAAGAVCPTGAFATREGIDAASCVSCGACAASCTGGAAYADLGTLDVAGRRVPITLRQSDRNRAEALCADLREMVLNLKFPIS